MLPLIVAVVVNIAGLGMAWYGMDFFCRGEAFDRYPLLDFD